MTKQPDTLLDSEKLLRGYYEASNLPKDFSSDRIVPDFGFNVLNAMGLLYTPVVDKHYLSMGKKRPTWPNNKPFAVCLTHDVDRVLPNPPKKRLWKRQIQLSNPQNPWEKARRTLGNMAYAVYSPPSPENPLHTYEKWLEIEKKVNGHSTFFFWPGFSNVKKHHLTDCLYDLNDPVVFDGQKCEVAEMIQEIDHRGWEIGLHASWYSYDNEDALKGQKETLEEVLNHEVQSVRQHCLHYDIRVTPSVHSKAKLMYDSTLGFNDNVGFRFGTCYPWHIIDLRTDRETSILEIPLHVQDSAMLATNKGLRLDEEMAFQYVVQISESVKKVGGVLTLLWHPHYMIEPTWWNLYLRTLQYLKERDAWFASVNEIGEWWKTIIK
jgi:peptidoglycan/xylan/chitin deacetylase (PgdA/CDA1 family)